MGVEADFNAVTGESGRGDGIDLYLGSCGEANGMYLSKLRTVQ